MAFKLVESAQHRWRSVNAPHLIALVRVGTEFKDDKLGQRSETGNQPQTAAEDEMPSAALPASAERRKRGFRSTHESLFYSRPECD